MHTEHDVPGTDEDDVEVYRSGEMANPGAVKCDEDRYDEYEE